jgi:large subunit ribosomal protein L4
MLKTDVLNIDGKKVSEIELNEAVFGVEVNDIVVHQALVNFLANQRQGTQSTKTRAEVRGGGIKPWKQKGTGRARQGSIRAPQWIKGGIALGPKPRDYRYTLPKKVKALAIKSVLTSKLSEGKIVIIDKIELKQIKTKDMVKVIENLKAPKSLVVLNEKNLNVGASARNIENVKVSTVNTINVYDLLKFEKLVFEVDAIKTLEEVYA